MKKVDFLKECKSSGIEPTLAEQLFNGTNGDFSTVTNVLNMEGDKQSNLLAWLKESAIDAEQSDKNRQDDSVNANDSVVHNGINVPDPMKLIVKVLAVKLQPSYRDGNGAALADDELNIGRSHFELQTLETGGKLNAFICAIRQMTHNLNIPLTVTGIVKRTDPKVEQLIRDVKSRIVGQFIIVDYNRLEKGKTYRYADDSDPSKYRTTTPRTTANHVIAIALDESGEYNNRHEDARDNSKARDKASVKIDTAQSFLEQMLAAKEKGLVFETVDMLKALIT